MASKNKEKEEYEVEEILEKRDVNGEDEYFVSWVGFPTSENSWEPAGNLVSCPQLVAAFERAQNRKSGRPLSAQKRTSPQSTPKKTPAKKIATPAKKSIGSLCKSAKKSSARMSNSAWCPSTRRTSKRIHELTEEEEQETPRKVPKDTIALLHEHKKTTTPGKSILHQVERTMETQDDDDEDEEKEEEAAAPGGPSCVIL